MLTTLPRELQLGRPTLIAINLIPWLNLFSYPGNVFSSQGIIVLRFTRHQLHMAVAFTYPFYWRLHCITLSLLVPVCLWYVRRGFQATVVMQRIAMGKLVSRLHTVSVKKKGYWAGNLLTVIRKFSDIDILDWLKNQRCTIHVHDFTLKYQ